MRSRIIHRGLFVALGGIIAVLLSVSISVTPAVAQCSLNYGLSPNYGQRTLSTGFGSYSTSVYIGGGCSARYLGGNCTGYATSQPDFRVFYNGPGNRTLRISATSSVDSTLIVNSATGRWLCDDDSGPGVNPLISISNAPSGQYDIWVGAYSQSNTGRSATLRIEEVGGGTGGTGGSRLDYTLPTIYGDRSVGYGFGWFSINLRIGGNVSASYLGSNCRGYATSNPSYRVYYNGGRTLVISATSGSDSTLIVNTANGGWLCDDDSGPGVNPLITIYNAPPGQYDIWVGAYSQSNSGVSGSLRIEESGSSGGGNSGGGIPSNRNFPPVGAYLLTGGRGLTNGAWMAPGEFQVEWYCEQRGYRPNYDWYDWFCQTSGGARAFTLSVSDFDAICRATYNNPGAFAIRDGYNQRPAFNWRCYGY